VHQAGSHFPPKGNSNHDHECWNLPLNRAENWFFGLTPALGAKAVALGAEAVAPGAM
ncbi:hypothetical protein A2U01_0116104, partial [Trifolium medium]|nr:hypothetical protein [Trifolium medium]